MAACYVSRCAMYRRWSESVETSAVSSPCCLPHRAQWRLSTQTHSWMSSTINYQHRPQLHTTLYAVAVIIISYRVWADRNMHFRFHLNLWFAKYRKIPADSRGTGYEIYGPFHHIDLGKTCITLSICFRFVQRVFDFRNATSSLFDLMSRSC